MKVKVNKDACIGCGMCIDICPEVFRYDEDEKSEVIQGEVTEELEDGAGEACEACPVDAIEITEQ